jgi:ATP-dependent Clp protease, protease subunit
MEMKTNRLHPIYMSASRPGKQNSLMTIKNMTKNSADLYIYGEIVDNTDWKWDDSEVMPDDVLQALNQLEGLDSLNIYINSPGGSVYAGMAIYNMLKRNKAHKRAYIDGIGASMASVIPFAADEVFIPANAFLMVHKPWTVAMGNANDFRKLADDLEDIESGVMNVYKANLKEGVDIQAVQDLVDAETWLTGDKAAEYFNLTVIEEKQYAACSAGQFLDRYSKTPPELISNQHEPSNEGFNPIEFQNELDLLAL